MVKDLPANSGDTRPGATKPTRPVLKPLRPTACAQQPKSLREAALQLESRPLASQGEPDVQQWAPAQPKGENALFLKEKRNVNWTEFKTVDQTERSPKEQRRRGDEGETGPSLHTASSGV